MGPLQSWAGLLGWQGRAKPLLPRAGKSAAAVGLERASSVLPSLMSVPSPLIPHSRARCSASKPQYLSSPSSSTGTLE